MALHFGQSSVAAKRIFSTRRFVILSLSVALLVIIFGTLPVEAQNTGGTYYGQQPAPATGGSVYGQPSTTQPQYGASSGVTPRPGYSTNPQPAAGTTQQGYGQSQSPYQPRTTVPAPSGGMTQQARPAAPQAVRAPFTLSPQQQAQVDQVLTAWCNRSGQINRFEAKFARWIFNAAFTKPGQNPPRELGQVWFVAPDKGRFQVSGDQPENWICDGKTLWEYNYVKKQVIGRVLPENMRGRAISQGPMPFLFNSSVQDLKQRYFIRLLPPPQGTTGQIWLEAYPRYMSDATGFKRAELIINVKEMMLHALQLYENDGVSRTAYQFYDAKINESRFLENLNIFGGGNDPFAIQPPQGWQVFMENQNAQTGGAPQR